MIFLLVASGILLAGSMIVLLLGIVSDDPEVHHGLPDVMRWVLVWALIFGTMLYAHGTKEELNNHLEQEHHIVSN